MANDIIRHDDIAEVGVMKPLQEELIETIKILNTLDGDIIKIATDLKKALANSSTNTSEGIKKLAKETKLASAALSEREKVVNATREAEKKLLESVSLESQELSRLRLEIQRVNAENKKAAKEQSITTGAYEKASLELIRVRKLWKDLAIVQKENTAEGKALKKQLDDLDSTLKKVDAAAGQHQRNVGNYASGFNGLRSSINQVTREMPAFVNSAQTGFMAISNNLPILIDEINRLKVANAQLNAEGQKGVPVWKSVLSSLFSWQTAMGVGITLMVTYGKEIGNAIKGLFGYKNITELTKIAQEEFNNTLKDGADRLDALTKSLIDKISFDTKSLVILAQKRGASAEEIFKIEEDGAKKELQVLADMALRKQEIHAAAQRKKIEMEHRYKNDATEENKALRDEARQTEEMHYNALLTIEAAYEAKKSEGILRRNQFELDQFKKLQADLRALEIERIKKNMELYKSLLEEVEKYIEMAGKLNIQIIKTEQKLAKEREEFAKEWLSPVDTTDLARETAEKWSKASKQIRDRDEKERMMRERQLIDATNKMLQDSFRQRNEIRAKEFDREIAATKQRQDALRDLAVKGVQDASNTLAFEERKQAELEAKRIKQQKNQKRQELIFAGLKAYSANVGQNPNNALGKTLKEITTLTAALSALPAFYEGTENVGKELGKPTFKGRDGYVVRVDKDERIVDPANNHKIGDLSNGELADIANLYNKGLLNPTEFDKMPVVNHYHDDRLLQETKQVKVKIDELNSTLKNRPVRGFEYDEVNKMTVDTLKTQYKTEIVRRKAGGYGKV